MAQLKGWREIPIAGMILDAGNAAEYLTGGWRAFRPIFGEAPCIHCMQCWLFCPDSSVLVDPDEEEMIGFDLDHCKGCGICAAVCPVNTKVQRQAEEKLAQDDPRLCVVMVEEGKFQE
jgi:pyruvate ferredoxin oxidoreductase delta subunit